MGEIKNTLGLLAAPPAAPKRIDDPGPVPGKGLRAPQKAGIVIGGVAIGFAAWFLINFAASGGRFWLILAAVPFVIGILVAHSETFLDDYPVGYPTASLVPFLAILQYLPLSQSVMILILVGTWGISVYWLVWNNDGHDRRAHQGRARKYEEYQDGREKYVQYKNMWDRSWTCTSCGMKWYE